MLGELLVFARGLLEQSPQLVEVDRAVAVGVGPGEELVGFR